MADQNGSAGLKGWRSRNRFRLQAAALILFSLAPFGLYLALSSGGMVWAILCFAVIILAMFLTIWAG